MRSLKIRENVGLSLAILLLLGFVVMVSKGLGRNDKISADNLTINEAATISDPSLPFTKAQEPQTNVPLPTPVPQPEQVLPEAPKVQQKPATKPEAAGKAAESKNFWANPGGKAYHLPGCPWVKYIPRKQLVKFSCAAEAAKAGYHPCHRCRPDHKDYASF